MAYGGSRKYNVLDDGDDDSVLSSDSDSSCSDDESDTERAVDKLPVWSGEGPRPPWMAGGLEDFIRRFHHPTKEMKKKLKKQKKRRRRRERWQLRRDDTRYPVRNCPPNWVQMMDIIVYQIDSCLREAKNSGGECRQPIAYYKMWKIIQYCKELRNYYNKCMIDRAPGFYETICSMMDYLERLLVDRDVSVTTLASTADEMYPAIEYFNKVMNPWKEWASQTPADRQRIDRYNREVEMGDDMGLLQTAQNRLKPQHPDEEH